jgi:hypothetical protein
VFTKKAVLEHAVIAGLALACACSDSTSPSKQPGGPGLTVTVAFCAGSEPNWLAFQDGNGAWTRARPVSNGSRITFQQTLTSNRAAVATARVFRRLTSVAIQYGIPAELAIVGDTNPLQCGGPVGRALLGSIAALDTNEVASVSAGLSIRVPVPPGGDNSFALEGLSPGPQEILATRFTRVSATSTVLRRIILRRTGDLPDSTILPVFDFASAESFAPATGTLTITGLGPEGAIANTLLRTAHSQSLVNIGQEDRNAATRSYLAIPEGQLEPGDLQALLVTADPVEGNVIRTASVYFRAPVEQTVMLGSAVPVPSFSTVATTPALRLRARFTTQDEYDRLTSISFQQGDSIVVTVGATAAYVALTGGAYDLTVPDLSQAPGFDPRWTLRPGVSVFWSAQRTGGTLGLGLDAVPTDGATSRTGLSFGTLP